MDHNMTQEELLASLNTELKFIHESLKEIKDNLTLGEGKSPLRDSVKVLVGEQIKEQNKMCANEMTAVARDIVQQHEKEFHKRTSQAPTKSTNWDAFFKGLSMFVKNILPWVIAIGGIGYGGTQAYNATQPEAIKAPADTGE